ncbi:MAG: class I SAM-dependent methyltransferase [Flammeovirgaceae bacterium]
MSENYLEVNKELWNTKTAYHMASEFYDLAGFKAGKSSLNGIELHQLGDISGKKLLHLQCHFGQDTLSFARMGATVTGVDLSDEAIAAATALAAELQLDADFVCCNVLDIDKYLIDQTYDIIFTSYGVIGWLPELTKWGQLIHKYLKVGGEFHIVEFHPAVWMFDDNFEKVSYSYFNKEVIVEEETGTYADKEAPIVTKSITWNHALDEVFKALLDAGLHIADFKEFDYSPYACFTNEVKVENGYQIKGFEGKLPMVYAIKAIK